MCACDVMYLLLAYRVGVLKVGLDIANIGKLMNFSYVAWLDFGKCELFYLRIH